MGSFFWSIFFSSRRRHTRCYRDWSSDVCSSDLGHGLKTAAGRLAKAPINPVLDYFKASHTFEALAGKEYPGAESDIALFRESGARVPSSRTSLHIGSELQRLSKLNVEPLHKMLGAALVHIVNDVSGL